MQANTIGKINYFKQTNATLNLTWYWVNTSKKRLNAVIVVVSFILLKTDVRIATKILSDAYKKRCDIAIIVSADSDLIPPVELIREFNPLQKVYVYFPPNRYSSNLSNLSDGTRKLDGAFNIFKKHILPQKVQLPNGYVIERPNEWK